ncbi:hypothetical protein AGMMS49928_18150 [Spirochaetia bacterium]|nr:hypothetical protein AGMMS49928_18150 [Spirochaetia bacterium]
MGVISFFKNFFSRDDFHIRIIAILCALALGFSAVLLGISIAASLFHIPGIFSAPGDFLANAYGILAFLIPAYMFFAAILLIDPRYLPGRIFALSCSLAPFFTLAVGFSFTRDYDARAADSPILTLIGKAGFSFIIVFLTTMEGLLIAALTYMFFPRKGRKKPALLGHEIPAAAPETAAGHPGTFQLFLPPPSPSSRAGAAMEEAEQISGEQGSGEQSFGEQSSLEDIPEAMPEEAPEDEYADSGPAGGLADDLAGGPAALSPGLSPDLVEALAAAEEDAALKSIAIKKTAPANAADKKTSKKKAVYGLPVENILNQYPDGQYWIIDDATRDSALTLKETLEEFRIQAEVTGIRKGPVITMFEILPAPGVKLSRIANLQDNIALRLAASSVRIVAPIPGKHAVGIEVPNKKRNIVSFREIIEGELLRDGKKPEIPMVLGKDITGEAQTVDLVQMPHLLIAGATGSGKSVCVNTMILSILYQRSPAECKLILIDPKRVELKLYNDIPHLLTPVITEPKKAFQALTYCIYEMERRYACLDSMGVRDIRSYNKRIKERNIASEHIPYIVVVIDEFADLMATTGKELESTVARLAAMSRAVGIHLVLATQRPSIDVITGLIKANIPSRIAFMVASKMDSRIIIDQVGAEKLLGRGDMLYSGVVDPFPVRIQGAFVSEEEVERVVEQVKTWGEPDYIDDEIFIDDDEEETEPSLFSDGEDPLYDKALEIVVQQGKASASYIQRRLKIGYNRAARLVEEMESHGVVGPAQGSKPRELLRGV